MKIRPILFAFICSMFLLSSCKKEEKNTTTEPVKQEVAIAKMETVQLNIAGMTCEIGCARTIQSKLSKKEGVASAKVVFKDNVATVEFDANKTSSDDLIAFIDGIAGGDLYKASKVEDSE